MALTAGFDSDVAEGVKTTRSNCQKFRLKGCYIFPFREDCDDLLNVGLEGVIFVR